MKNRPTIYDYTDYRKFLDAYYTMRKHLEIGYSYRAMSAQLGFSSPNFLKLVIDGKRHLGEKVILQIANGLELKKFESEYFTWLVRFAKAETESDRAWFYSQIARLRTGKMNVTINDEHYRYYEEWYTCIVRELILGEIAESIDYAKIARTVIPNIHYKQAEKSVKLLLELQMVIVNANGRFEPNSPILRTGNEVTSYAIKQYHRDMITFGLKSIDTVDRSKRDISSVTMKISKQGFSRMKERIQQFREELLQILEDDEDTDRVYQFNMQLFPVSEHEGEETV